MNKTDNQAKYDILRTEYPTFYFESSSVSIDKDQINISYHFHIEDQIHFYPSLSIPVNHKRIPANLSVESLEGIAFHIGMVEMISYWKTTCSPRIVVKPFILSDQQIEWWKKLYYFGMGEFFYRNGIYPPESQFLEIISEATKNTQLVQRSLKDEYIIPVGGGKDSVVTLEILSGKFNHCLPFVINPNASQMDCIRGVGFSEQDVVVVNRTIHPKLLELNAQGLLNGHTPFSALVAFMSVLVSILTGKQNIALSNESSANESTVAGSHVNHQYSKSFEFERDFRNYVHRYIHPNINYFSFLRPLNELQIAKLFSKHPAYFSIFRSCNAGKKTNSWCGHCSKCLFAYIIISPFIEQQTMLSIFGCNMLDDEKLLEVFKQLIGETNEKPFECVGTIDEVNTALCMALQKMNEDELPFLLRYYKGSDNYMLYSHNDESKLLDQFDSCNFLGEKLQTILKQSLR